MSHDGAYGLWSLVVINAAVFVLLAFSFAKPQTSRDWRSFGAFSAFLVALFVELYGFPLTIDLLSGWLARRFPQLDIFSHESGHLWHTLFGWQGDPHFDPFHLMAGFLLQWPTLATLLMFPVLVFMYMRLAHREEGEALAAFGTAYEEYARRTPRWVPRFGIPTRARTSAQ